MRRKGSLARRTIAVFFAAGAIVRAQESLGAAPSYSFNIASGSENEVCTAYSRLLNMTHFGKLPQCALPAEGIAGFRHLQRKLLSADEIARLFPRIYWFSHAQVQNIDRDVWLGEKRIRMMVGASIHAWRYEPAINIGNGTVNLVVWQGYGTNDEDGECGTVSNYGSNNPQRVYSTQYAFVMTPDNSSIDEEKTRQLFAPSKGSEKGPFIETGWTITPFEYKQTIYIATFAMASTSKLFVTRESHGQSELVCEISMAVHGRDDLTNVR